MKAWESLQRIGCAPFAPSTRHCWHKCWPSCAPFSFLPTKQPLWIKREIKTGWSPHTQPLHRPPTSTVPPERSRTNRRVERPSRRAWRPVGRHKDWGSSCWGWHLSVTFDFLFYLFLCAFGHNFLIKNMFLFERFWFQKGFKDFSSLFFFGNDLVPNFFFFCFRDGITKGVRVAVLSHAPIQGGSELLTFPGNGYGIRLPTNPGVGVLQTDDPKVTSDMIKSVKLGELQHALNILWSHR